MWVGGGVVGLSAFLAVCGLGELFGGIWYLVVVWLGFV